MRSFHMSWFLTIIILSFTVQSLSEAKHEKNKHPSAVIVGTVYCDTCFVEDFSKSSHFISGALVAVECSEKSSSKPSFRGEVKTNEHGEFKVHLPFLVSKNVKQIKGCSVKLISSSEPYCAVASTATSTSLHLKSRKEGVHIFSAGFFTFKPMKQPDLCNQKPSFQIPKKPSIPVPDNDPTAFPTPVRDLPSPILPPIDQNHFSPLPTLPMLPPLPQLPPLPPLPGLPYFPPVPTQTTDSKTAGNSLKTPLFADKIAFGIPLPPIPFRPPSILPPNPFQPPPSILPPNPFQPPPSILPPNPFQPPPSILPPNPFQPPPSILPPNPFQPQPPPSILPPNPFQPRPPPSILPPIPFQPPPPAFSFPPIPGLTSSPPPPPPAFSFPPIPGLTSSPPPPPPVFRIPIPPFPFQPSPGFPGVPPASSSKNHHP